MRTLTRASAFLLPRSVTMVTLTVEIQHFDGDIDEISREEWMQMEIEESVQPENWSGAVDVGDADDLGTDVTDTSGSDWTEPQQDFRSGGGDED